MDPLIIFLSGLRLPGLLVIFMTGQGFSRLAVVTALVAAMMLAAQNQKERLLITCIMSACNSATGPDMSNKTFLKLQI